MADITAESIGVYAPAIDDRSEERLYQQAQAIVLGLSNGELNDFSDHGPLGVMLRGQAFSSAELLYRVNKLPLALVVKLLELTGVERSLGAAASVSLRFVLTAPRPVPFTVPKGFIVGSSSGNKLFTTDELLIIPAGELGGNVTATAIDIGTGYNLPAYQVNQATQPLAFLAQVINAEPAQGGLEAESLQAAAVRGLARLRERSLVSAIQFRRKAEEVMGQGSRAKAIGLLGADATSFQPGAVHVFCLSPEGNPANQALQAKVAAAMSPFRLLGTSLYVSPMGVVAIAVDVVAKLKSEVAPAAVADSLWAAMQLYLSPSSYEPGASLLIQELRHQLRFALGIESLDAIGVNGGSLDLPMPNGYTLPTAYSLSANFVTQSGAKLNFIRGAGEPLDYDPQR
jgi:hypothetical protein